MFAVWRLPADDVGPPLIEYVQFQLAMPAGPLKVSDCPASTGEVRRVMEQVGFSVTVTVNEQVSLSPWASVTVQVTVVVPMGNKEPEAGVQLVVMGVLPPTTVGAG